MDYGDDSSFSGEDSMSLDGSVERAVQGAPIDEDALDQFIARARSIRAVSHPYTAAGVAWISDGRPIKVGTTAATNSDFQKIESSLFQIPPSCDETLGQQRMHLVSDHADIFDELQSLYDDQEQEINIDKVISTFAKRYRTRTYKTLEEIQKVADDQGLSEADELWQQALSDTLAIWQCAEAIYMPESRDSLLCDGLMAWVNNMDQRPSQQDGEEIMAPMKPYLHPGFWDYISKSILRGLFEVVGTCLQNSGLSEIDAATSKATNDICLLLRTCPRAAMYPSNVQDFRDRHRIWRAKVIRASNELSIADSDIDSAFRQLYELLRGDKDAIYRQSDSWQECLAALALLFDPSGLRAPKDVRALFEMITESDDFGLSVDRTLPTEVACAALCSENIPKAITNCKEVDLSLAALLSDLLDKAEILEDIRAGDLDLTLRDVHVLSLADECILNPDTWKAAVIYWRTVGDAGLDSVQQVLPRIPVRSQAEVDEVLRICHELEFSEEASEIETVWARKLENQGNYNDALNAYDRAEDSHQIDRLNWSLFEDSLVSGKPASEDPGLVEALESPQSTRSTRISVLMAPYATLASFYRLKEANEKASASRYLAALIQSPDVPKQFTAILLAEMLPFIAEPKILTFSQRDIFDSLAALEEFLDSEQYSNGLALLGRAMSNSARSVNDGIPDWRIGVGSILSPEEVLQLLRIRVSRCLAARFYEG